MQQKYGAGSREAALESGAKVGGANWTHKFTLTVRIMPTEDNINGKKAHGFNQLKK